MFAFFETKQNWIWTIMFFVIMIIQIQSTIAESVLFEEDLEAYTLGSRIPLDSEREGILSGQSFSCPDGELEVVSSPIYAGNRALKVRAESCKVSARVILSGIEGDISFEAQAYGPDSTEIGLLVKDKDEGHIIIASKWFHLSASYGLVRLSFFIESARKNHRLQFELMNNNSFSSIYIDNIVIQGLAVAPLLSPILTVTPTSGIAGSQVTVVGENFPAGKSVQIEFGATVIKTGTVGSNGVLSLNFSVPELAPGVYVVTARSGDVIETVNFTITSPPLPTNLVKVTELVPAKKFKIELLGSEVDARVTAYIDGTTITLNEAKASPGNYEGIFEDKSEREYQAQIKVEVEKGHIFTTIDGPQISIDTLARIISVSLSPEKEAYRTGEKVRVIVIAEAGGEVSFKVPAWGWYASSKGEGERYEFSFTVPDKDEGTYQGTVTFTQKVNPSSSSQSFSVNIDNTPPVLEVAEYWVSGGKLQFIIQSEEDATVRLSSGTFLKPDGKGGFRGEYTLQAGETGVELIFIAEDKAGNRREEQIHFVLSGDVSVQPATVNTVSVYFKEGINLFGLPLNIGIVFLSQLMEYIGDVEMIIYYNEEKGKFVSLTETSPVLDKEIKPGEGFIVVMERAKVVSFIGTAWQDSIGAPYFGERPISEWSAEDLRQLVQDLEEMGLLPPEKTILLQNYPNPFNPETWIPYKLAQDAEVTLSIYNLKGYLVRTFREGRRKKDSYVSRDKAVYWDGRDQFGQRVPAGVYFYTLQAGSLTTTRKMVLLK